MRVPLVAILLIGLSAGCQPATRPPRARLEATPYYPLEVGNTWVYSDPGHKRVMREWPGAEEVNGVQCALVQTLRDGGLIEENDLSVTSDGVYIVVADGQKLPAPMRMLKLPPRSGATWHVIFNKEGKHTRDVYLMGQEDVTVPAGKYRAVTLQRETREGATVLLNSTYWFARGVGIVKQLFKSGDSTTSYELERFEKGR